MGMRPTAGVSWSLGWRYARKVWKNRKLEMQPLRKEMGVLVRISILTRLDSWEEASFATGVRNSLYLTMTAH